MTPEAGLPPLFGAPWERERGGKGGAASKDLETLYADAQIDVGAARHKIEKAAVTLRKRLPLGEKRVVDEVGFDEAANAVFALEQELGRLAEANM